MIKQPSFKNKDGSLTHYALACGLVEETVVKTETIDKRVRLHKDAIFQVQAYDFNKHERICWESFDNLTEARKFYNKIAKEIKNVSDS